MSKNTEDNQAALSNFDSTTQPKSGSADTHGTTTESEEQPESPVSNTDSPDKIEQSELPPVTVWDTDERLTFDGATVLPAHNPGSFVSLPSKCGIHKNDVMYVHRGLTDYLSENDCRQISIPKHYSGFDDFVPIVTSRTAAANNGAFGIDGALLENAIRYIARKGGFSHSELSIYVGAKRHFIIKYEDEAYLVAVKDMEYPDEIEYTPIERSISGIDVVEENDELAAALPKFFDVLDTHYGITVTGHRGIRNGTHRFDIADPVPKDREFIEINGNYLKRFSKMVPDSSLITGEFSITTDFDEEYPVEITSSDIEHSIGDPVRNGYVIGFTRSFEDPRSSSRASMSGRVKAYVNYHYILQRETSSLDYRRFELRDVAERVAEFEPENKEYDPLTDYLIAE